jgi:uncharacterized protein YyaL (SSP411 family)
MNDWFINIKVDREERPIWMPCTCGQSTLTGGRGGWPNNVFLAI